MLSISIRFKSYYNQGVFRNMQILNNKLFLSRAVYPVSELETSRWIKENSAVCEFTGFDIEKISKDQLHRISKRLYAEKELLEDHLSVRTNELFDIVDRIVLYDLTNTYFEGRMSGSTLAKFGRSKEKRSDAKLIVLALVVNPKGFIKYAPFVKKKSVVHKSELANCQFIDNQFIYSQ